MGLNFIGCEISEEYAEWARRRIASPDAGRPVPADAGALKKALAMEQDSEVQGALRLAILTLSKLTPSPEEPKPPAPRGR